MNHRIIVFSLPFIVAPVALSAQRLQAPIVSWRTSERSTGPLAILRSRAGDRRMEGAVVGALFLGAVGYWIGHEACTHQPEPTSTNGRDCGRDGLMVGLVGGGVGAGLGYLIG